MNPCIAIHRNIHNENYVVFSSDWSDLIYSTPSSVAASELGRKDNTSIDRGQKVSHRSTI